ncbi:MAG: M28 family peptidase [Candidatus Competibacteraceae bacterium]
MDTATIEENLRRHVQTLAGDIGERNVFRPSALRAAADYIGSQWRRQGYEVRPQPYEAKGVECMNLEVSRVGRVQREDIILIGAHYDSVLGSPGADDNGSGVAALLELSRLFAQIEPAISVRFVAFVNEEPPFFARKTMGSLVYAKAARRRGDRIKLMVSLEMLGCYDNTPDSQKYPPLFRYFYPNRGNFIAFVSNLRSRRQLLQAVSTFRAHSDFPSEYVAAPAIVPGLALSDHLSFWRQRYPAIMITDTAFYRYRWYHTALDTPDRLHYQAFAKVTEGLYRAFAGLAEEGLPQ